jgi:WD40 repeat protein
MKSLFSFRYVLSKRKLLSSMLCLMFNLSRNTWLFQGHKKWITGLAWEPVHLQAPCRRFASSSKDGDVRVWDTALRKCVMSLTGHTLAVTCVKWGGDGMIYSRY